MAESQLKGVKATEDKLLDAHEVMYKFTVHRLDAIRKTFHPVEYNTGCKIIPTMWRIELKYERIPENNDTYTFTIKLRRRDSSNHRVKASVFVTFYDVHENALLDPFMIERGRIVPGDEVERVLDNIQPSDLSNVVAVRVSILIEQCHTGAHYHCASKLKTDNRINLSKL